MGITLRDYFFKESTCICTLDNNNGIADTATVAAAVVAMVWSRPAGCIPLKVQVYAVKRPTLIVLTSHINF